MTMRALFVLSLVILSACAPEDVPRPPPCVISTCTDGVARSCDGSQVLMCPDGTGCADFLAGDATFGACGCSDSAFATCTGERTSIVCAPEGRVISRTCEPGSRCTDVDGALPSCLCDDRADGICPTSCPSDPDCASCTPSCTGRSCGDNGCGGTCGSCDFGLTCDRSG